MAPRDRGGDGCLTASADYLLWGLGPKPALLRGLEDRTRQGFGGSRKAHELNNLGKNLFLWVVIGVLLVALFNLFRDNSSRSDQTQMAYSDFVAHVNQNEVREVTIQGHNIRFQLKDSDGRFISTYAPTDPQLVSRLTEHNVRVRAVPEDEGVPNLFGILVSWFPFIVLIGVWVFFMRQMQSGGGRAMGFGKSRARLLTEKAGRVTFDDVAGIDEAKQEL